MNNPGSDISLRKVLITGASGMLGHYLKEIFKDCELTTLGRSESNTIRCDLTCETPHFDSKFDLVVHAAGTQSEEDAEALNLEGTRRLLAGLSANPPHCFVMISCASVYGKREGENLDEMGNIWPSTHAGKARALAEKEVTDRCEETDTVLTILRPAPMFGAGIGGEWNRIFRLVASGRYVKIREAEGKRSFVLAYDVARLVRLLADTGGVYNVTDGSDRPLTDMILAMCDNGAKGKRPYSLPRKWYATALNLCRPFGGLAGISQELANIQEETLTFSTLRLQEKLREIGADFKFHDTVEVIGRRDETYPYEDS